MASSVRESCHDGADMRITMRSCWSQRTWNQEAGNSQSWAQLAFVLFSPLRDLRSRRDATKVRIGLPVLVRSRKSLTVCPEVYLSEILGAAKLAIWTACATLWPAYLIVVAGRQDVEVARTFIQQCSLETYLNWARWGCWGAGLRLINFLNSSSTALGAAHEHLSAVGWFLSMAVGGLVFGEV